MNPFTYIAPKATAFIQSHRHWLTIVLVAVLVFAGGYGTGRYISPPNTVVTEKVHEVTQTQVVTKTEVQVQKVYVHDKQVDEKVHRVIAETTKPDGEKTKTTTEDIGIDSVVHDNTNTNTVQYVDRVVEKQVMVDRLVEKKTLAVNDWRIAAGAGVAIPYFLGQGSPGIPGLQGAVLSLEADRRILGPFWLGVSGNTQGVVSGNLSVVW